MEESEEPPNGSLVLALLHRRDGTVGVLYRNSEKERLRLQNSEPRELILHADEVRFRARFQGLSSSRDDRVQAYSVLMRSYSWMVKG